MINIHSNFDGTTLNTRVLGRDLFLDNKEVGILYSPSTNKYYSPASDTTFQIVTESLGFQRLGFVKSMYSELSNEEMTTILTKRTVGSNINILVDDTLTYHVEGRMELPSEVFRTHKVYVDSNTYLDNCEEIVLWSIDNRSMFNLSLGVNKCVVFAIENKSIMKVGSFDRSQYNTIKDDLPFLMNADYFENIETDPYVDEATTRNTIVRSYLNSHQYKVGEMIDIDDLYYNYLGDPTMSFKLFKRMLKRA